MNESCRNEPLVIRAAAENRWTEALRTHAASCLDCSAAAEVAPFMAGMSRVDVRQHVLPDPAVIWVKAQLFGGSEALDRVTRPMNVAQIVSYVFIAAGWAGLLMWKWTDVEQWVLGFTRGQAASLPVSIVLVFLALASTTAMLALHTILAEE